MKQDNSSGRCERVIDEKRGRCANVVWTPFGAKRESRCDQSRSQGRVQRRPQRFESGTKMLTAAKTISGTPPPESPFRALMDTAMTRTLILALLFATLANALCLVGRF